MPSITSTGRWPHGLCAAVPHALALPSARASSRHPGTHFHASEARAQSPDSGLIVRERPRKTALQAELLEQARRMKLAAVHDKATPYLSNRDVLAMNLNCQVLPAPQAPDQGDAQVVACRHFAQVFGEYAGKKSQLMTWFSTKSRIADKFAGKLTEIDATFAKTVREAPQASKHVVGDCEFGRYLTGVASALQTRHDLGTGESQANCLLITGKHAMALHVQRKSKAGVDYFSAKLYDPNNTANYKRVEALTPDGLSHLTLDEMLTGRESSLARYGACTGEKRLYLAAVSMDPSLCPVMEKQAVVPSAGRMHVALSQGIVEAARGMLEAVKKDQLLGCREKMAIVRGKCSDGFPGQYVAFQNGHTETVQAFTESILAWEDLGRDKQLDLLMAKTDRGTPGLHAAFEHGHTAAVEVFTDRVLACQDFDEDTQRVLLAARASDGVAGLYLAFQKGHAQTVVAFTQRILACPHLTEQTKVKLLSARCRDGFVGLYAALEHGHAETVKLFIECVAASKALSAESKRKLLAAQTKDGFPGLYVALHRGHTPAVTAFMGSVLTANGLDARLKVDLIAAKTSDGVPGLLAALTTPHAETVKAYVDMVAKADLSAAHKVELLTARCPEVPRFPLACRGASGLAAVRTMGRACTASIEAFAQAVKALPWPEKDRILS